MCVQISIPVFINLKDIGLNKVININQICYLQENSRGVDIFLTNLKNYSIAKITIEELTEFFDKVIAEGIKELRRVKK